MARITVDDCLDRIHNRFDLTLAAVEGLIAEGTASGEIAPCDRIALCWALVGSYHTILEEQICRTPPRIGRAGLDAVIGQILDGVAPRPPSPRQGA